MSQFARFVPSGPVDFDPFYGAGNCYTYSLNLRDKSWAHPGQLKWAIPWPMRDKSLCPEPVAQSLQKDGLVPVSDFEDGAHIIAAFLALQQGPHFYRRHSDGTWSHKLGTTPPMANDFSGAVIHCPLQSDLGAFTEFVGFYKVPESGIEYCSWF